MEYDATLGRFQGDIAERDASTAARSGSDYAVALGRNRLDQAVDDVATKFRAAFPESFGGLAWENELTLVAQFKGPTPSSAARDLAALGVEVRTQNVKYSESELTDLNTKVRASLDSAGYANSIVGIDPRSQSIVVTVISESGDAQEQAVVRTMLERTGAPVNLTFDARPVIQLDATGYGGADLNRDFQHYECTTGFTVETSGLTTAVSTAGHCVTALDDPENFYWDNFAVGPTHHADITLQTSYMGTLGDFMWITTSGADVDDFYYENTANRRDVSGLKTSFSAGQFLYWYGRKTKIGYGSTIGYIGITTPNGVGNLVCVYSAAAQQGDSGGPVYNGTLAAGSITSLVPINNVYRLCVSRMDFFDDALGVGYLHVKTS